MAKNFSWKLSLVKKKSYYQKILVKKIVQKCLSNKIGNKKEYLKKKWQKED